MKVILKIIVVAAALWVATKLVPGIEVTADTTGRQIGTLLAVALIFGIVNAVLKPIIKVVGCAFYVVTLGLFALVVNAGLLWLTGWISDQLPRNLHVAFQVDGFWAAFWGAIVIGVVSWVLDLIIPGDD